MYNINHSRYTLFSERLGMEFKYLFYAGTARSEGRAWERTLTEEDSLPHSCAIIAVYYPITDT